MTQTYQTLWERITAMGTVKPTTHILDNEAPINFKNKIKQNCTIQLVPPDNHRRNLVERAIQTFKNHFKAILAGVDDSFSMQLWDKLIPQTILKLNLLRKANAVPTISAYQYVTETSITTKCLLHQWDAQCKFTRVVREGEHGWQIQLTGGTYKPCPSTTNATKYASKKHGMRESQTQCFSKQNT